MQQIPIDSEASVAPARISRSIPLIFYFCSLLVATGAALLLRGFHPGRLADLSNLMGPLAENLAHGHGYAVCTDAMTTAGDSICYHASRMPLPPLLLAGLIRIFGDHYQPVQLAKIALVLLPVAAAMALVEARFCKAARPLVRFLIPAFLFTCLALPVQLIDVVNMQVEEGYSFCLLTYAVAVLLFAVRQGSVSWRITIFFGLGVVALYLTKSSMIAAAAFLVLAFCIQVRDYRKRVAVLLLVACGPIAWGLYTHKASGRFSIGTSLDGINLHKGNYPQFVDRYPPSDDGSLDRYDNSLTYGSYFEDEWRFNASHIHTAESYMESHPGRTAEAMSRKAQVFFISLRKIGSGRYSGWLGYATNMSMVLFRLLLWSACGVALWFLILGSNTMRWGAVHYLGTVGAVALPYLIGFALTRHAGVLVLPSAFFLCWCYVSLTRTERQSNSFEQ